MENKKVKWNCPCCESDSFMGIVDGNKEYRMCRVCRALDGVDEIDSV